MSATEVARPLRKDAAENRERLLQAAAQVFAEQGLEASVEEVARVAGVGMGTLYRRFPTKEALIAELVAQLQQEFIDDARRAMQVPDGFGLETFLHDAARRQASHRGCLPRLWNSASTTAAAEEIGFRGYAFWRLIRLIGFWPAQAIVAGGPDKIRHGRQRDLRGRGR